MHSKFSSFTLVFLGQETAQYSLRVKGALNPNFLNLTKNKEKLCL